LVNVIGSFERIEIIRAFAKVQPCGQEFLAALGVAHSDPAPIIALE